MAGKVKIEQSSALAELGLGFTELGNNLHLLFSKTIDRVKSVLTLKIILLSSPNSAFNTLC